MPQICKCPCPQQQPSPGPGLRDVSVLTQSSEANFKLTAERHFSLLFSFLFSSVFVSFSPGGEAQMPIKQTHPSDQRQTLSPSGGGISAPGGITPLVTFNNSFPLPPFYPRLLLSLPPKSPLQLEINLLL